MANPALQGKEKSRVLRDESQFYTLKSSKVKSSDAKGYGRRRPSEALAKFGQVLETIFAEAGKLKIVSFIELLCRNLCKEKSKM